MKDECSPKRLVYGELCDEKISAAGQRKRYKDTLKSRLSTSTLIMTTGKMQPQIAVNGVAWGGCKQQRRAVYSIDVV